MYTLEGAIFSELDAYNALPVLITGTINIEGKPVVDSYKIPYPDLRFQTLKCTQREEQLEGQTVIIFTTEDGNSYIEPVWHFQGRYENGTEFDVLIQALKQEFLLPELAPGSLPG